MVIVVVFGILQIILFFKIWGMTNDVSEIKRKYLSQKDAPQRISNNAAKTSFCGFNNGDLVVELKTERQMRFREVSDNGKLICSDGNHIVGEFDPSELMDFDKWVKDIYKK